MEYLVKTNNTSWKTILLIAIVGILSYLMYPAAINAQPTKSIAPYYKISDQELEFNTNQPLKSTQNASFKLNSVKNVVNVIGK